MDLGEVRFINTKYFNKKLLVVNSERSDGCAYKFMHKCNNRFECCRCKELKHTRSLTIKDGKMLSMKHPDDGHHPDCVPLSNAVINALEVDQDLRSDVKKTGKHPRDAYTETLASIPKKLRSSTE